MGVFGLALQRSRQSSLLEEHKSSQSRNSTKISRLTFMSTMCGDPATAARRAETIATQAVSQNVQKNLSGHMLYDADMKKVWQVVEGSHDTIAKLWKRISEDDRHVIDEDAISHEIVDSRKYPVDWGLRYTKFEKATDERECQALASTSSELIQLKYKSFLKEQDAQQIIDDAIPDAIVKNARLDVTGFLLYNDNTMTVYQVLEGPAGAVEKMFNEIQQDPRQEVCAASVHRREVQAREFPHQSMALEHVKQSVWTGSAY
jgi:acylphosphatase